MTREAVPSPAKCGEGTKPRIMKKEELFRKIDLRPEDPFVWFEGPPVVEEIPWGYVGVNRRKLTKIVEKRPPRHTNMVPLLKHMMRGLVMNPQVDGGILPLQELAGIINKSRFTVHRESKLLVELGALYQITYNGRYAVCSNLAVAVMPGGFVPYVAPPLKTHEEIETT